MPSTVIASETVGGSVATELSAPTSGTAPAGGASSARTVAAEPKPKPKLTAKYMPAASAQARADGERLEEMGNG